MLIEELYKQTDKLETRVDSMLHNEVNISALTKAVEKLMSDVEKLQDKMELMTNKDEEIMEQHKKLFEALDNNQPTTGYNYN